MSVSGRITSYLRFSVNTLSRVLIRDEAARKRAVERYYAMRIKCMNRSRTPAQPSPVELLDWRLTLSSRIDVSREVYRGNTFYGIGAVLAQFAGSTACLKGCIEHGIYFGSYVNPAELHESGLPCVIVSGPARLGHIRQVSSAPVAMVGPYIAYAAQYLSRSDRESLAASLGRTLLVFPTHSIDRASVSYEHVSFLDAIDKVVNEQSIRSVVVCLYYRDLLSGLASVYERRGYTVVTAGYREDRLFLPRLKSLIEVADLTMSNSVGTHVGYCAYLGKPHFVFPQEKVISGQSAVDLREFEGALARHRRDEMREVELAFNSLTGGLTSAQAAVCEKYWGFSQVRSRESLSAIFKVCAEAFEETPSLRQTCMAEIVMDTPLGEGGLFV